MLLTLAKLILFNVIVVADLLKNIFSESLMGTTIQDSGIRVRRARVWTVILVY